MKESCVTTVSFIWKRTTVNTTPNPHHQASLGAVLRHLESPAWWNHPRQYQPLLAITEILKSLKLSQGILSNSPYLQMDMGAQFEES